MRHLLHTMISVASLTASQLSVARKAHLTLPPNHKTTCGKAASVPTLRSV